MVQRFESVKGCVQELQRDMTMRRCLAKTTKVTELLSNTSTMEEDITKHLEAAEKQRPLLEKVRSLYRKDTLEFICLISLRTLTSCGVILRTIKEI